METLSPMASSRRSETIRIRTIERRSPTGSEAICLTVPCPSTRPVNMMNQLICNESALSVECRRSPGGTRWVCHHRSLRAKFIRNCPQLHGCPKSFPNRQAVSHQTPKRRNCFKSSHSGVFWNLNCRLSCPASISRPPNFGKCRIFRIADKWPRPIVNSTKPITASVPPAQKPANKSGSM
jgi:hypothetical protein